MNLRVIHPSKLNWLWPRGAYVQLEGMPLVGKSTLLEPVAHLLCEASGMPTALLHDPYDAPDGPIKDLILACLSLDRHDQPLSPLELGTLMMLNRVNMAKDLERDYLGNGTNVLSSRGVTSTVVFQGERESQRPLTALLESLLLAKGNWLIILDIPYDTYLQRRGERKDPKPWDSLSTEEFRTYRERYWRISHRGSENFGLITSSCGTIGSIIDATAPVPEVLEQIRRSFETLKSVQTENHAVAQRAVN
jgi:thymidylate kinase